MSEVCRNCGTNEGIGCKEHSVTHSNANEGRTPILPKGLKRCGRCHKAWKNCTCEGIPAPADASQGDALDDQGFYEVMQNYRHVPLEKQQTVALAFEDVKRWVRERFVQRDSLRSERGGWITT